jgi:hypothetical protein
MEREKIMSRRRLKCILAAAAVVTIGMASAAQAGPAISVNFVNNGNAGVQNAEPASLGAAESAGAPGYEQTNWNNMGRWGGTVPVNDNTGAAAAGVTITWDSNNTWTTGSDISTPNGKLMNGYIDALGLPNNNSPFNFFGTSNANANDNRPIVYVKGLSTWLASKGASTYSIVAYVDGDGTDRKAEYWVQGADSTSGDPPSLLGPDLTSHVFVNDIANFNGTFNQVPLSSNTLDGAVAGNFVVFTGLSADAFLLRSEEQNVRAEFNGFQIIADVPEPASLSLVGLGLTGLLARRRRPA